MFRFSELHEDVSCGVEAEMVGQYEKENGSVSYGELAMIDEWLHSLGAAFDKDGYIDGEIPKVMEKGAE